MLKIVLSFKMLDSRFCSIRQLLLPFLLLMLDTASFITRNLELHHGKKLSLKKYIVLKEIISVNLLI